MSDREQEKQRILTQFPREIEDFKAGDRIEVHRFTELGKPKIEIMRGICLGRRRNKQLEASFQIINSISDATFILTVSSPLHFSFLASQPVFGVLSISGPPTPTSSSAILFFECLWILPASRFQYPLYSPYITKIKVIEKGKWRRNKLNFIKEWPSEHIATK